MNNLAITIMAAGEGKRMNSTLPKVLHLFNGIPMLIRIILEVIKLNPNKIIIVTGKYDTLIKSTINKYFQNNDNLNITLSEYTKIQEIIFIKQNIPNGTGDAIKCTLSNYDDHENVLILNGDTPMLSSSLLNNFLENLYTAKILVSKIDNPFGYGRIIYDNKQNFIEIIEEKDCDEYQKEIKIINAGIYLFNAKLLKKYIPLIDNKNSQKEYYLTDIIKIIRSIDPSTNIKTFLVDDKLKYQIHGINTQEELQNLEKSYNNMCL